MKAQPVVFTWKEIDVASDDGEVVRERVMVPLPRYGNVCARQFADGEEYTLAPVEERSQASHNAYFAELHSAWLNLPEEVAKEYFSELHFRRSLLIATGFCIVRELQDPYPTLDQARAVALFARGLDEYAKFSFKERADGWHLIVRQAKSQSRATMSKDEFQRSKQAVLEAAASMIGVPLADLRSYAQKTA